MCFYRVTFIYRLVFNFKIAATNKSSLLVKFNLHHFILLPQTYKTVSRIPLKGPN